MKAIFSNVLPTSRVAHHDRNAHDSPSKIANLLRLGIKKIKIFCSALDFS